MAYAVKIGTVEDKIRVIEGFSVKFMQNGIAVRRDKEGVPQYSFLAKAPQSWTVREWMEKRFKQCYPGYEVKVIDKAGREVINRQTKLENIR